MTTPKWLLGLMAVAALVVSVTEAPEKNDCDGTPKSELKVDQE